MYERKIVRDYINKIKIRDLTGNKKYSLIKDIDRYAIDIYFRNTEPLSIYYSNELYDCLKDLISEQ